MKDPGVWVLTRVYFFGFRGSGVLGCSLQGVAQSCKEDEPALAMLGAVQASIGVGFRVVFGSRV